MDVKIEKTSETKREIEVIISPEEMEEYIDKAAKKLSGEMNIKGFRPGHAPRTVIENTKGKEVLFEEAAKEAIQETYPKIIEENNLFALSAPQVNLVKCVPGNEVIYKALVYIMPEIKLPDYKKISGETAKKEKNDVKVEEREIDQSLENIRETKAKLQKVEREAKTGDAVTINFKGVFDEKEDKKVEEKNFQIVLGRGDMGALEGFEENIMGMKEGEKKSFSLDVKQGGNQKIDFEVDIVTVLERELPEVDDELASSFPNIENLKQLREKIGEGIKTEKEKKEKEKVRVKILEKIKEETSFEVPEVLTEKEIDNMIKTVENQMAQSGSSFDDYLKEIGKTEDDLRKDFRKKAEENVSYALILHAISKEEDINVTPEEIEKEVDRHFSVVGKSKDAEKKENLERMRNYIHDVIKNQKVFRILSIDDSSPNGV